MANGDSLASGISRRQWLSLTAGGAAGMLAGCSSSSDSDSDSDGDGDGDGSGGGSGDGSGDGGGGTELAADTFHTTISSIPTDQNFNVFASSNAVFIDVRNVMHSWPGVIQPHNSEIMNILAEDWNIGEDTASVTLRDDVEWHNGDPVTARDFIVTKRMYQLMQGVEDPMFTDFTEVDEQTVEFAISSDEGLNEDLVQLELFTRTSQKMLACPESVYGDMLADLEDAEAEGEDALQSTRQEFAETQIEETIGAGPWAVDDISQQQMEFVPHEGHPGGSELNFDRLVMHYVENSGQEDRGMINDEYDGLKSPSGAEDIRSQFPDHVEYVTKPTYSGKGLLLNQERFPDWRVRQALAHAIDPTRYTQRFASQLEVESAYYSGISQYSVDAWIPEDLGSSFNNYSGRDVERATELLQEAGYTQDGNSWVQPNGDSFSMEVKVASTTDGQFVAPMIEEDLGNFGIDISSIVVEASTRNGDARNGNYDAAFWGWGALNVAHPYQDMWEMFASGGWWRGITNQPGEVEAPPLGEPNGSTQTYQVGDMIDQARIASGEEMETIIQELAWVFNQTVPIVMTGENGPDALMTNDDWNAPLDDPMANALPPYFMFSQTGDLQAQTE